MISETTEPINILGAILCLTKLKRLARSKKHLAVVS